jgi:hypothetical protein
MMGPTTTPITQIAIAWPRCAAERCRAWLLAIRHKRRTEHTLYKAKQYDFGKRLGAYRRVSTRA